MFSMIYLWIIAIGSGQLKGKGLFNTTIASVKNGNFLSEEQTDFIFAVIGAGILFQLLAFAVFAIAGCVYLSYRKRKNSVSTDADHLQHINDGHSVEVKEWKENGKARVFYRGTVWDAKPEKGSPMVPGLWEIVGMSGNTLIIKLKQEK